MSAPDEEPEPGLPLIDDQRAGDFEPEVDASAAALGGIGSEASSSPPWPVLLRRRVEDRAQRSPRYKWWVLGALLAGLLSVNITFTVFVVALPTVAHQLHTNYSLLTWTSTGPLLAFGLAAPFFGKAGDLFGHRRLYQLGLIGGMVSAVLTALSPNVGVLLIGRTLDGIQGAATGTASMAIILKHFAPNERVKALGWQSLVGAGGPVLGVTIGSPIIQYFGWRALFWGQLGLLVLSSVVVALLLPAHGERAIDETPRTAGGGRWAGMDWIGSWSLSGAVTGFMLVLSIGPLIGWSSPGVIGTGILSVGAAGVFVHRELRFPNALIPRHYWSRANFVFPMGARAGAMFGYFGAFFLFPLLMERVYHYGIAEVGLVSIARPLVFALSSPIAGYLAVRIGERTSAIAGSAFVLASMVTFALLTASSSLVPVVIALVLAGLGMGVGLPSSSSIMSNQVKASEFGVMSAAQLLATQVGEVAGIQVLLTIQESVARHLHGSVHTSAALLGSFRDAFWVGAAVSAAGLVCTFFIRRSPGAERAPVRP